MSEFATELRALESDERFARLSYEKQVEARRRLTEGLLPNDPRWGKMTRSDQQSVVYEIATRRPVFEGPTDQPTEDLVAMADTLPQLQDVPEEQWTPEQAALVGRAGNIVSLHRWRENSLFGKLLTKVAGIVPDIKSENLDTEVALNAVNTEQGRKAADYLATQMSNNQDLITGFQRFAIKAAPIAGVATDVVAGRVGAQGPLQSVRAWGKATAATAKNPWIFRSAIPELAESGLDAMLISVNDAIENRTAERLPQGMRTDSALANTALNFGVNVAADMAIFTGLSLVGKFAGMFANTVKLGTMDKARELVDDEAWRASIQAFDSGRAIPNEVLRTMPKEVRRNVTELTRLGQIGRRLPDVSEAELGEYVLATKGYRVEKAGDGIRLRNISPTREIEYLGETYANTENAIAAALRYDVNVPDRSLATADLSLQNTAEVSQRLETTIEQGSPGFDRRTLSQALTPVDDAGTLNRRNVEIAAQSVLAKQGVENVGDVRVRQVTNDQFDKLSSPVDIDNATIYIPEHIKTSGQMDDFVRSFNSGINKFVPDAAKPRAARYVDTLGRRARQIDDPYNPAFLEAQAAQAGTTARRIGNQWQVGDTMFDSTKEANDFLVKKNMHLDTDLQSAQEAFGRQFGIRIEVDRESGRFVARKAMQEKGGTILSQGSERLDILVDDLMKKGYTPKPFHSHGPDLIIDPSTSNLVVEANTVRGPLDEIVKYSQKYFKPVDKGKLIQKLGEGTISRSDWNKVFRVRSAKYGNVAEFGSFDEAKEFLTSSLDSFKDLRTYGVSKGVLDIRPSGDKIIARTIEADEWLSFDTLDQLKEYLTARSVDPTWAKEISGLDTTTIRSVVDSIDDPALRRAFSDIHSKPEVGKYYDLSKSIEDIYAKRRKIGPDGNFAPEKSLGSAARSLEEITTIAGKFAGTPKYITFRKVAAHDSFRELTDAHSYIQKQIKNSRGTTAVVGRLLEGVRKTPGVDAKRRGQLLGFIERDPQTWDQAQKALKINLTAADRNFLDRYREVTDRMATLFGIEPYKMMRNYLPDLRRWLNTDQGRKAIASHGRADQVLKVKYGSRIPKELEFFSKYTRNVDLHKFTEELDPLTILEKYAQQGVKQMTMGAAYEEVIKRMNEWHNKQVPEQTIGLMYHYLEEVMGMYSDMSSKVMEELGTEIATTFSKKARGIDGKVHRDFLNMLQGLTVGATMSFRVWPLIRNLQQNWLTLAPRIGNERVAKAMKTMIRDPQKVEETYNHLLSTGRLQQRLPVFGLEAEGVMKKYNEFGMKFYKSSDHVNRLVAHFAIEDVFREATLRFESGIIDEATFLKESGLRTMDPSDQRRILETMESEGFDQALDTYGDIITDETHFTYNRGDNPAIMSGGVWGRIFGQFGHWPIMFRQNLMNQLRRGTVGDKLKFASRMAFNAAALTFTFEKVLGLRADSFKPHKMMFFGGGPYFNLISDITRQAAGDFSAPGWDSIRRDAGRLFLPGSLIGLSAIRSIEEFEKGNLLDGMALLVGLPDLPEPMF